MELRRLTGRKHCALIQRKGKLWKGTHVSVRWLPGTPPTKPDQHGVYVGTVASLKLHKSAVKRNRMRRRCREALRRSLKDQANFPTIRLLLYPRSSSLDCDFADIESDIDLFLSSV